MNIIMEKTIHKWLFLLVALFSYWYISTASAQSFNLQIRLQDGTVKSMPANEIVSIEFKESQSQALEGLAGHWMLVASPVGIASEGGVYTSKIDTIRFVATWAEEPDYLLCHADTFCIHSGVVYSADWQVQVSKNEQDGSCRLGWILSEKAPVFAQSDINLYLLSENLSTQRLEGMTLWSGWQDTTTAARLCRFALQRTFTFPQYYEIYGVLSPTIPYSAPSSKYLEILASPHFVKVQNTSS